MFYTKDSGQNKEETFQICSIYISSIFVWQKISFLQPEHRCQEKDGASEEEGLSVSARVLALMDHNIHLTGMRTFLNMGEGSQTICNLFFFLDFLEHLHVRN